MSKARKVMVSIVIILAVASLAAWGVWRWFSHQAIPQTEGTLAIEGLSQPVEVVRDENGVAHIYATTTEDLFFAEGYVHAQERFWQMEFQRRIAVGRLSEVFGEATLGTDRYLRQLNFGPNALKAYKMMDEEARLVFDAYAAGVNAYIQDRTPAQLGLEFALLNVQGVTWDIEPWTPIDSLGWSMMMIYNQSDVLPQELENVALLNMLGEEMYADLRPGYRADRPTIIPPGEFEVEKPAFRVSRPNLTINEAAYLLDVNDRMQATVPFAQLAELGLGTKGASNSFVVSGAKTDSGMPYLANDPHMAVMMPALWYQVGLQCVEQSAACKYNLRGFSLPGVPGILIGHNDRIAWGLTNAAFDAEDIFIERTNPQNPNQYEVNGQWADMLVRREEIKVRGQDAPVVLTVRSTRNGLVITDTMTDQVPYSHDGDQIQPYVLAFAWTALQPIQSAQAVLMVNRAQNWEEFNQALRFFDAGKQNWLFADVDGNIGYVMPGKLPIRAGGDGTLPVPGWNDDYIWTGFVPYEDLPKVFNPAQGFIITANNPQLRLSEYPYLLGMDPDRGQRAQRLTGLIQSDAGSVTRSDMTTYQTDNQSLAALEILPYLKDLNFTDAQVAGARDRLLAWDGQTLLDSSNAALYSFFWAHLLADTFQDQLPEDYWPGGDHVTEDVVANLLQDPTSIWWDNLITGDVVEDRDTILSQALEEAVAEGVEKLGKDLDAWQWGELHTITFRNATLGESGISLIEKIFNRGPFPTSGSLTVVQKTCWDTRDPYRVLCIPALRQVIDLGNLSNSLMIHSVGQSGHPLHPQYDNFIELWRTFQYLPSNWTRTEAEAGPHEVLVLEPAK